MTTWGQFHQHVYEQILCLQIPKTQKKLLNLTVFFALLGSARVKAACKMLVKLTPGQQEVQLVTKATQQLC